ncbi:ligand-dependent nuclear receptor corepressor-like protein isoform X3 [Hoplias malabaricus]|uniref:ligand-dependent nuclear receptor corepressor-like protein isoform X3 n=1 Tax=Hoplias malabaricus TaxID=27720 RepID=UPI0034620373
MATRCRSARCASERRGARRELETWRHKLIACVGFESILEGIYGPRLLQDLSIFDDCEPEVVSDWSTEACCPFCNLQLEKLIEHSPVSPPPTETPPPQGLSSSEKLQCQASQFLHAVFHKKEFPESGDPSIPLAAQELMRKMIRQFAIEYVYKSQPEAPEGQTPTSQDLHKNGENDGPLDLTVSRETHESPLNERAAGHKTQCPQQEGVLDLSKKNSSVNGLSPQSVTGRPVREDYLDRSSEFAEGLLSKALKDIRSGSLDVHKAAILYGIPQKTLRLQAAGEASERKLRGDDGEFPKTSEAQLLLQKVVTWTRSQSDPPEGAKLAFSPTENVEYPAATASSYLHRLTLQRMVSQLRERGDTSPPQSPAHKAMALRIPQVRSGIQNKALDLAALLDTTFQAERVSDRQRAILPKNGVPERLAAPESRLLQADLPPLCVKNGAVGSSVTASAESCEKQPRKKRGRYRQYDHDILEEAIAMVMGGKMSVSKAQGVYGVPHSTLEYKVKERMGTLKTPPKKKLRISDAKTSGSIHSGTKTTNASTTAFKRF